MHTLQDKTASRASVIVSAYNQGHQLLVLLTSLAAQDGNIPFEVIVCDDGSSDDSAQTIATWADRNPAVEVRHIWQPDRGFQVARSRNNGIRCAEGQILIFVDCDVWLAPYFLKDHWDAHHCGERRLVCGALNDVFVEEHYLKYNWGTHPLAMLDRNTADLRTRQYWLTTTRPWMACTSGNFSVHRDDAVLFDEQFGGWGSEDRDYAYRVYEKGVRVHVLDRTGALHLRIRGEDLPWNPFKGGTEGAVIAALLSKLRLSAKYPGDLMQPSIELVRKFRLDETTDRWTASSTRSSLSEMEILDLFRDWLARHGRELDWQPSKRDFQPPPTATSAPIQEPTAAW